MHEARIGIIIGTIRAGRFGDTPAEWILELGSHRADLELEIVDLREYPMAHYGEPLEPSRRREHEAAVERWRHKMDGLEGYVFMVAEYNHTISGTLKNALDHASTEFNRKPAAFMGYGGVGGARAVEQLRLILVEFQMAPLRHA